MKILSFVKTYRKLLLIIMSIGMVLDIFSLKVSTDIYTLILIILWLITIYFNGLSERISLQLGLIFLIFCPLLIIIGNTNLAEKVAIWAYIFLSIGIIQSVILSLKTHADENTE